MLVDSPLQLSRWFLGAMGIRMFVYYQDRIPRDGAVLIVSNHRSFMDAPVLMVALEHPIRFACHHYMGQVPILREIVMHLGCFPLEAPERRHQGFFQQGMHLLQAQEMVGLFPEGASPMVRLTDKSKVGDFQRGFAHLAFRAPVKNLVVLPVAIASSEEVIHYPAPVRVLSLFDPSEPLFRQDGWHPVIIYRRVNVLIGRPYWITSAQQQSYQGKQGKNLVHDLLAHCHGEIADLVRQGC